jgi:putative aldouronate transport system permease protein
MGGNNMSNDNNPVNVALPGIQSEKNGVLKYYLIALPAIVLILIFKIIPFFGTIIMSFKNYRRSKGLFGSETVGLSNYKNLFSDTALTQTLQDTLTRKFQIIILTALLAVILAVALSYIKGYRIRKTFSAIFLIPYFVPAVVLAYALLVLMSYSSPFSSLFGYGFFEQQRNYRLILILLEAVRNCGIPVIIALAAIYGKENRDGETAFWQNRLLPAVKVVSLLSLIQVSAALTLNLDIFTGFDSFGYHSMNIFDMYILRTIRGTGTRMYGQATAAWLLKFFIQAVLAVFIYNVIKRLSIKDLFKSAPKGSGREKKSNIFGLIVAVIYSLLILVLIISPAFAKDTYSEAAAVTIAYRSIIRYLFIAVAIVLFNTALTVTLAYPFTFKNLPGRKIYNIFLIMVMSIGTGGIYRYIFATHLGPEYIQWAYMMIAGSLPIINVFIIKGICSNEKYEQDLIQKPYTFNRFFTGYVPKISKAIIALSGLNFLTIWGNVSEPLYKLTANTKDLSPVVDFMFKPYTQQVTTESLYRYGLLLSVPSLLILVVVLWLGDHRIFIGQAREA